MLHIRVPLLIEPGLNWSVCVDKVEGKDIVYMLKLFEHRSQTSNLHALCVYQRYGDYWHLGSTAVHQKTVSVANACDL